ncbi:MAG: hypothetical protein DDT23_00989 [candidate division WS2 bacterium]|nr:hypothetical protein [Candidatus Lithacetigena glycinireducens]
MSEVFGLVCPNCKLVWAIWAIWIEGYRYYNQEKMISIPMPRYYFPQPTGTGNDKYVHYCPRPNTDLSCGCLTSWNKSWK